MEWSAEILRSQWTCTLWIGRRRIFSEKASRTFERVDLSTGVIGLPSPHRVIWPR